MGGLHPMRIKFLTILTLLSFAALPTMAQSLEIIGSNTVQYGVVGDEIHTTLHIKNISDKPVYFRIVEFKKQLGSSQKALICINNECFDSKIAQSNENIGDFIRKINPGEVDESISFKLETGLVQGVSSIIYSIQNVKSPSDFTLMELQYEVNEKPEDGLLYSSKNLDLSDVYPNPVSETAIFDYRIKNDTKEAKIIIHNVLGTIAGEYDLNPFEQQLKVSVENFNPGVYFYSLYIDNEGVATKKLVIRK
jgi:hypothetical protein